MGTNDFIAGYLIAKWFSDSRDSVPAKGPIVENSHTLERAAKYWEDYLHPLYFSIGEVIVDAVVTVLAKRFPENAKLQEMAKEARERRIRLLMESVWYDW